MRVVGGELRGRRLHGPPPDVRPTSDRVREAIFSILGDVRGRSVLDLYAGTGALGIEALSRGADACTFVDRSARSLAVLRRNLDDLGLAGRSRVVRGEVLRRLRSWSRAGAAPPRFDLVFLDPPYEDAEIEATLAALVGGGLLATAAEVVVESAKRHPWSTPAGLDVVDERRYGDTLVCRLTPGIVNRTGQRESQSLPMSESNVLTRALFPASFDPLTNGHLDLIHRTRRVFPELVVAVAHNVDKRGGLFSVEERLDMLREVLDGLDGVRITSFSGLLVDYVREIGATVVIRGLRAMSDFEYEFEMALMNKHLHPDLEILFMMTSQENLYVSSSRLKELASFGQAIDEWVPRSVAKRMREKLA